MAKAKLKRPGGYIQKHEEILASPAYRDLKPVARCLLEEFQRIYRPGRNGKLSVSTKNAASLLNVSEPTASNAFYDLVDHGFLVQTKGQLWQERLSREWRLTIVPSGNNHEPTDEWKKWPSDHKNSRPKKQGQNCSKKGGSLPRKQGQSISDVLRLVD